MPTYVYKFVDTGETIEVQQAFTDDTLTEHVHPDSGDLLPVKKVFQPVGVTFKGSGFFKTDNRGKPTKSSTSDTGSNGSKSSGSNGASGSDSSGTKSSDSGSKSESGSSSASSSDSKKSSTTATSD